MGLRDAFAKMRAAGIKKKGPIHTVATKILLRNLRLGKEITLNAKRKMTLRKMGKSPSVLSLLRKMKGEH